MSRLAALVVAVLLLTAPPAPAQPAEPIDLARGLRENGLPDLALEYLQDLSAKRLSPGALAVIPLERARARLELAAVEADDAKRGGLVNEAKADFDRFLAANATHPRRAEAALSLARLVSVQAKGMVSKANRRADDKDRVRDLLAARPVFDDAAKRFSQAAAEFAKKLDDAGLTPSAKRAVQNDLYQAQLDQAVNKFQLAMTYPKSGAANVVERAKSIDESRKLFLALGDRDATHPLCWVALAWAGECEAEKDSPVEAQKRFDAVKKEAVRAPTVAGLGARTARFFELRSEFLNALSDKNPAGWRKSQAAIEAWLADPAGRSAASAPEAAAARYYLAKIKIRQAEPQIKTDPKTTQVTLSGNARELLQSAERDFRRLLDPENDYTARAADDRAKTIRTLIGDPDKVDPAKLADFETGLMVAQVQYYRAVKEADTAVARQDAAAKAVATYERLQRMPVPREFARDALEAQANLAYAYTLADKPYQAAVLAESIARTSRSPATASRAGLIAITAYRQAGAKVDQADAKGRRGDLDRAMAVGLWLDKQFPLEAHTDNARVQIARDMVQNRRYPEGFKLLTRVANGSPSVLDARYLESIAAVEMLRAAPAAAEGVPALSPAEKAEVYQKALADLQNLPETPAAAPRGDARLAVLLTLQLGELHFLNGVEELPKAEATAGLAGKKLATFTELTPEDKAELEFRVELSRMRALWGQAVILFQAKKYGEAVAKVAPVLQEAKEKGPVFKDSMEGEVAAVAKRVDEYRREKMLGLAMQARIREGAVDQVGELLDVLKKLGGSLANSGATLGVMIDGVRPQIDALRKEGKAAEADALMVGIGSILDKVAAEPDVKPPTIIVLAQGLNSIGNHDKAVEFLKKIAAPADATLMKKRPDDIPAEADKLAALRYRIAQLEMARAYRQGKKYALADAILKEAVGDGKPGSGWTNNADFKREAAYLLEAKATGDPTPASAVKLWGEARAKWTEMANQYFGPLKNLSGGKNDPRLAMRALLDLNALPKSDKLPPKVADIRAALTANPPPKWLTDLTVERVKGADGKLVEQPEAMAYVEEMRNTSKRLETTLKPLYHDLVFESIRCGVKANLSLLKADPAKVAAKLEPFAKQLVQLETGNPDMADEVKAKFADLLDETPALKDHYQKAGGKAFLKDAPPAPAVAK